MACSVATIRTRLSPDENAVYKDYQIERWIASKRGNQAEVLQLIAASHANERRLKTILTNPQRKESTLRELRRNVLSIIHVPSKREVVFWINSKNKNTRFVEQDEGDGLLIGMYYLVHKIAELEGEGHKAVCIIDMLGAPSPKMSEIDPQSKMFTGIVDRTFTGIFTHQYVCNDWGGFARKAVSSISHSIGMSTEFIGAEELLAKYGRQCMPSTIGGELDLRSLPCMADVGMEYVEKNMSKLIPAKLTAAPTAAEIAAQEPVASGSASATDQYTTLFLAAGCMVVAYFTREYISLMLFALGLLYLKFGPATGYISPAAAASSPAPRPPEAAPADQQGRRSSSGNHYVKRITEPFNQHVRRRHTDPAVGDSPDHYEGAIEPENRRHTPQWSPHLRHHAATDLNEGVGEPGDRHRVRQWTPHLLHRGRDSPLSPPSPIPGAGPWQEHEGGDLRQQEERNRVHAFVGQHRPSHFF